MLQSVHFIIAHIRASLNAKIDCSERDQATRNTVPSEIKCAKRAPVDQSC